MDEWKIRPTQQRTKGKLEIKNESIKLKSKKKKKKKPTGV
jgi:hypothetical protein